MNEMIDRARLLMKRRPTMATTHNERDSVVTLDAS